MAMGGKRAAEPGGDMAKKAEKAKTGKTGKSAKAHGRMTKADLLEEVRSLSRRLEASEAGPPGAVTPTAETESLYKILEASPIGVTIVRDDGSFEFVNSRMAEMVGLTKEQFLASSARDLYADPKERDAIGRRLRKEGRLRNIEMKMRRADGTDFWILLSFEKTGNGAERRYFGWVYDISEIKQTEEALRKNEEQFRIALDHMSGGLFMVDKDFNYQVASPSFTEIYEIPAELVYPGAPLKDTMAFRAERGDYGPGNPKTLVRKRLQGYLDGGVSQIEETLPDGRVVESFRAPTPEGGIVAVFNDITERKRAEEALRASERKLHDAVNSLQGGFALYDA